MKREQQIYRPGSGPLRKSNSGVAEDPEPNQQRYRHDKGLDQRLDELSLNKDLPRRQKKPEQQLYVPKPIQAREIQEYDHNFYSQANGNDNDRYNNKSKRFHNQRRRNDNEQHDEWRNNKPHTSTGRHIRQGSEPRGII